MLKLVLLTTEGKCMVLEERAYIGIQDYRMGYDTP